MSNLMLENGVYSVTQPIPSSITSGAVLMAENELFDQVYVKENTKNTKKISISDCNGTAVDSEDGTVDYHHYHRRKTSSAQELDPGEEATLYCSKRTKKNICNILVVISLIAVVCLYSLGIVFFYTNVPENENIDYETQSSALLNQLNQCKELESAGNMATTQAPDNCFSYTMASEACLDVLQSLAMSHGINSSVMVQYNSQAGTIDPDTLFNIFNNNPLISEDCRTVGLPLFCQYFYPICNPADGTVISITEEQCTNVTEGVCKSAVQLARNLPMFNVPECGVFESESSGMKMINNSNNNNAVTNSSEMLTNNITCHPQFDLHCGKCVPACSRFSETTEEQQTTIDIFFIIAALTCVIGGTFVIFVSILRRNVMFDFPSVLIIYMTLVMMLISTLVLISYGARDHLYCSQPELPLAYENPTFFCQFSGFVLHAGVLQIVLYWLLHLIHLFLKFIFPFAIRHFDTKKWKRIFHITELILIILVTAIAPIYIILDSKYYPYGFPPVLCVPNATLTFYSLVLPLILMLCLGTCIILLMFWRLQVRAGFIQRNASKITKLFKLSTAEFKVVILLCFFLIFGVVNAIYFSLYSRSYDYVLSVALEYVICQLDGYEASCEVHKDEIEKNRYHGLANTSYLLMGLLTISNFLFAIHVKQLKVQVRRLSVKAASKFRSTVNPSRVGVTPSKQSNNS